MNIIDVTDVTDVTDDTEVAEPTEPTEPTKQSRMMESIKVLPESMVVKLSGQQQVRTLIEINNIEPKFNKSPDILFLIDTSGSMHNNLNELHGAMEHLASHDKLAQNNPSVAFGTWNSWTHIPGVVDTVDGIDTVDAMDSDQLPHGYTPWMPIRQFNQVAAKNFATRYLVKASGGTNMLQMFKKGLAALKKRREDAHDSKAENLQHLVVLTDGKPDIGQAMNDLTNEIKNGIGDVSVVVHILLLGEKIDLNLSKALCIGTTGGVMAYAEKGEDLAEAFDSILKPIFTSSRGFTLRVQSNGLSEVKHLGILSEKNNKTLVSLNFGPKKVTGSNPGAKISLLDSDSTAIVMPYYTDDVDDPAWKSSAAKMPVELEEFIKSADIEERIFQELLEEVQKNGYEEAHTRANALISEHGANLAPPVLQRVQAFSLSLQHQAQASRNSSTATTALSRAISVSASYSRVRYE